MACKKEKIKLLLILGKVFIVACACTELVFDKGVFQKKDQEEMEPLLVLDVLIQSIIILLLNFWA